MRSEFGVSSEGGRCTGKVCREQALSTGRSGARRNKKTVLSLFLSSQLEPFRYSIVNLTANGTVLLQYMYYTLTSTVLAL